MEAGWNAVRDMDRGNWRAREILCVQDDEVSGVGICVDDKPDQPAVILGRCCTAWDEDELSWGATGAEVMDLTGARLQILFVQAGCELGTEAGVGAMPWYSNSGRAGRNGARQGAEIPAERHR